MKAMKPSNLRAQLKTVKALSPLAKLLILTTACMVILGIGVLAFYNSGFLLGSTPLRGWLISLISHNSDGGTASFSSIKGTPLRLTFYDFKYSTPADTRNFQSLETKQLDISFALWPVLLGKLDITEIQTHDSTIQYHLSSGLQERLWTKLDIERFSAVNAKVVVHDLSGYDLNLANCDLEIERPHLSSHENFHLKIRFKSPQAEIGQMTLIDLESSAQLRKDTLVVENLEAVFGGGDLVLSGKESLTGDHGIHDLSIKLSEAKIEHLLPKLGYSERFSGVVSLELLASGNFTPTAKSLNGSGHIELSDTTAKVVFPTFPMNNDARIIRELKVIKALRGENAFLLENGSITANDFELMNDNLDLKGSLRVHYDKEVKSSWVLNTNEAIAAGIPEIARNVFKKNDRNGAIIPFEMVGTTEQPKVKMDYLIAEVLKDKVKGFNPLEIFKKKKE
ncbi:MAG: AsmA-like C-terminal region-containing protein [Verrucomicrobiota bacterium]